MASVGLGSAPPGAGQHEEKAGDFTSPSIPFPSNAPSPASPSPTLPLSPLAPPSQPASQRGSTSQLLQPTLTASGSGGSSRDPSRGPSPIRRLPRLSSTSRATSTATSNITATGSSFSSIGLPDAEAASAAPLAQARLATSAQSLRARQEEVDASPQGRLKPPTHSRSQSIGPKPSTKVVMLQVDPQPSANSARNRPEARRSISHRPPSSPSLSADRTAAAHRAQPESSSSRRAPADERESQRLKAATAAKLAEQEAWERTRGAGSDVLSLLDAPRRPEDRSDDSGESGGGGGDATAGTAPSSRKSSSAGSIAICSDVQRRQHEPVLVSSADKLLSRGISEYTLLPRILGRGKFSSVFLASKPSGPGGAPQLYAVKHTPLFPHHPLIATRLLREPTLLAELPPHPNLVNVNETIRTPGHFYLVEEYLEGYVTLEALLSMRTERPPPQLPSLPTDIADRVLDQLLSAVQAIHHPLQICHRDIKPENILVHPDTLHLKLLDFGLATHYSRSEPKLTTCCGSPAFHCPEIVTALRNPQGAIRYWGPEVDAWTCGITMLRVLTGVRYPIGASHTSVRSMASRAQRAVATIRDPTLRTRVGKLLDANGERRMHNFRELVDAIDPGQADAPRGRKDFKSTTFIPTAPQHTMKLPLVVGAAAEAALKQPVLPSGGTPIASCLASPAGSRAPSPSPLSERSSAGPSAVTATPPTAAALHASPAPTLILSNRDRQPPQRVLSFVKYCLRCAGILYHGWPDTSHWAGIQSTPSTPGPWEDQLADLHERALSGLQPSSATGGPARPETLGSGDSPTPPPLPSLSPTTPFPVQAERPERDPFVHVHIFECVLELVEEPADEAADAQPSLVQTIMSALSWGKRPAGRRTLSTPSRPDDAVRAASRPRTGNGNMPRSSGQNAAEAASPSGSGGPSGKPGDIDCLRFYIVVRFPRKVSSRRRPGYSRSHSRAAELGQDRSRASSVASFDGKGRSFSRASSLENLTHLTAVTSERGRGRGGSGGIESREGALRSSSSRRLLQPESNRTTPRASRTASPDLSIDTSVAQGEQSSHRSRRARTALARAGLEGDEREGQGLTVETSPEALRRTAAISSAQQASGETASAPASRAGSRAPSRSRRSHRVRSGTATGSRSVCDKVLIHVTDERAVAAVRKALSVGGTTDDFAPDAEVHYVEEQPWMSAASPSMRSKELGLTEDQDEPFTPQRSDQKRRRPAARRTLSYGGGRGEDAGFDVQRPRSITSIDEVTHGRRQLQEHVGGVAEQAADAAATAKAAAAAATEDVGIEPAARGRPLVGRHASQPAGTVVYDASEVGSSGSNSRDARTGVPFPARRGRAPSQLSTVILAEESPTQASTLAAAPPAASNGGSSEANPTPIDGTTGLSAGPQRSVDLDALTAELASGTGKLEVASEASAELVARLAVDIGDFVRAMTGLRDAGGDALAERLDPISFDAFKALSPALGLVHANGRRLAPADDAMLALSVLGETASPRELYMAIDLRCHALVSASVVAMPLNGSTGAAGGDGMFWTPAAEAFELVGLLGVVVPRIRTKRPQSFSSVFALLADLIGTSMRRTAAATSPSLARTLAHHGVRRCCALIVAVADWEARCNGSSGANPATEAGAYRLSQEALSPFLAAISHLLPYLPRNDELGLAEAHFRRSLPQYAFTRPGDGQDVASAAPNGAKAIHGEGDDAERTWSQLASTIGRLNVDLANIWTSALQGLGQAGGATPGDGDQSASLRSSSGIDAEDEQADSERRLRSTLAVGGFALHVHLLARGSMSEGPASWSAATAGTRLEQGLPMLILALGTEMEQAASGSSNGGGGDGIEALPSQDAGSKAAMMEAVGRESVLSDTSLTWLLWCLEGLGRGRDDVKLSEALVVGVAQVLASHMALSPSPVARHARLRALQGLVCDRADEAVALRTIGSLARTSPFSQVRAACVGLLRAFVLPRLSAPEHGALLRGVEAQRLLGELFEPIAHPPLPSSPEGPARLEAFLSEHVAVLQEKAGLLYVLVSAAGVDGPSRQRYEGMRDAWTRPLRAFTDAWLRRFETRAADVAAEGRQHDGQRQVESEVLLLRTALERLEA
ncbi:uncharacterized protein PSFLO_06498 [Pseudozyma flocculosa]|uniref:Protein kinase domain-containing protein n=1 Tax=Pseudozyma flocculosa TaxID=84751 RepID=A0A5C3FA83_9BASI|nr:uncharacterized protein PSFLO_06498 [Pseudozyma flocculosa]